MYPKLPYWEFVGAISGWVSHKYDGLASHLDLIRCAHRQKLKASHPSGSCYIALDEVSVYSATFRGLSMARSRSIRRCVVLSLLFCFWWRSCALDLPFETSGILTISTISPCSWVVSRWQSAIESRYGALISTASVVARYQEIESARNFTTEQWKLRS